MLFTNRTADQSRKRVADTHNKHGGLEYPFVRLPEKEKLKKKDKRKKKRPVTLYCGRMRTLVRRKGKQRAKPLKTDIQSVKRQKDQSGQCRIKVGLKIGRYKKNHDTHGEMYNFSDHKSANTQFLCQQFCKKNKKQHKTERQEKGRNILGQWRLKIQHGSILCSEKYEVHCTELTGNIRRIITFLMFVLIKVKP